MSRASSRDIRARSPFPIKAWLIALLATPLTVGGQAVIEGVMMRSPRSFAVAVRRRDKSIVVREQRVANFLSRYGLFRWPLVRGAVMLLESLHNGMVALNFAADQAMLDEQPEGDEKRRTPPAPTAALLTASGAPEGAVGGGKQSAAIWFTLAIAIVAGLGIFVGLPHLLTYLIGLLIPGGLDVDSGWFHLIDGAFKLAIFILYIKLISKLEDIRHLFMYHGAEHMAVHTFEAKLPLVLDEARGMSTAHPRCGTSLILWVVAISIFIFAAVFPFIPIFFESTVANQAIAILWKIMLTFPIAGIAYEAQRYAARHPDSVWVQRLIWPGMAMQALTTRQPGDAEIEVALTALRKVLWREEHADPEAGIEDEQLERFTSFEEVLLKVA